MEHLLLLLARAIGARYGLTLVSETPRALLPSRLAAVEQRISKSGHLANRFHVRQKLDIDIAALREQIERMAV